MACLSPAGTCLSWWTYGVLRSLSRVACPGAVDDTSGVCRRALPTRDLCIRYDEASGPIRYFRQALEQDEAGRSPRASWGAHRACVVRALRESGYTAEDSSDPFAASASAPTGIWSLALAQSGSDRIAC